MAFEVGPKVEHSPWLAPKALDPRVDCIIPKKQGLKAGARQLNSALNPLGFKYLDGNN